MIKRVFSVLLIAAIVGATVGVGAAQTGVQTRNADLAIQQPHYIDSDVEQTTRNGTRLYRAQGSILKIAPQNIDPDQVVDFGVQGDTATLTYDSQFDTYRLRPDNGTGTYKVYWTVNERVSVVNAASNETENATEQTTHQMKTVRYTALVRISGKTNLEHHESGEIAQMREDASNWREFNSTIHSADYVEPGVSTEKTVQEMVNWYELHPSNDPLSALTGNMWAVAIILVSSIGGGFILVILGGYHQITVHKLYRKLNIFQSIEAEEGTAKEAIEELEFREKQQALQNMDWQDIFGDDHVAAAFREQFGETVGEGTPEYLSMMRPRTLLCDRLRAMGHSGYVAVVDGKATTDGGDDSEPEYTSVRVEPEENVSDDVETIDLVEVDDDTLEDILDRDVLDWDSTTIWSFDLAEADYDASELETTYESMDLDTLVEELKADMRHFDSPRAYGEYMREFVESVREHPFCDEEGRPDDLRYLMTQFLQKAQLLEDRFDYPLMHWHSQAWERALIDYDPEGEAMDLVKKVRQEGA